MEVTLKVLDGAKKGAKIPVKKSEFLIGRSQACQLCAGSSAISRQHCLIARHENRVTVKDMGSRNGTLVNDVKIAAETELKSGDELVVGPLKFLVTISAGINNQKKPQVKSVAEAVERVAAGQAGDLGEDDISKWLLGGDQEASPHSETKTVMLDETHSAPKPPSSRPDPPQPAEGSPEDASEARGDGEEGANGDANPKLKGPGKLPNRPPQHAAKDSQSAAAEALRNWNRRK